MSVRMKRGGRSIANHWNKKELSLCHKLRFVNSHNPM